MISNIARILIALCVTCSISVECYAEVVGYWSFDLPIPASASNPERVTSQTFFTKKVSFDWRGHDLGELHDFYSEFFHSIGWGTPHRLSSQPVSMGRKEGRWNSQAIRAKSDNTPYIIYGTSWKANDYEAIGSLSVAIIGVENDELLGEVTVEIEPEIKRSSLYRLSDVLTRNPENLFKIEEAVNGHPGRWYAITLPAGYQNESDPLLREYYQVVAERQAEYKNWWRDNVEGME